MKTKMNIFTVLSLLISISQLVSVSSSPVRIKSREADNELIVWSPRITYPVAGDGTVWQAGTNVYNITWDTTNIPRGAEHNTGVVMLGYHDDNYDSDRNEHLNWQYPLASGFLLTDGAASFTISADRNLTTMDTYCLCLLGDSGNISPTFTILQASSDNSTQSTSQAQTAPTNDSDSTSSA